MLEIMLCSYMSYGQNAVSTNSVNVWLACINRSMSIRRSVIYTTRWIGAVSRRTIRRPVLKDAGEAEYEVEAVLAKQVVQQMVTVHEEKAPTVQTGGATQARRSVRLAGKIPSATIVTAPSLRMRRVRRP